MGKISSGEPNRLTWPIVGGWSPVTIGSAAVMVSGAEQGGTSISLPLAEVSLNGGYGDFLL